MLPQKFPFHRRPYCVQFQFSFPQQLKCNCYTFKQLGQYKVYTTSDRLNTIFGRQLTVKYFGENTLGQYKVYQVPILNLVSYVCIYLLLLFFLNLFIYFYACIFFFTARLRYFDTCASFSWAAFFGTHTQTKKGFPLLRQQNGNLHVFGKTAAENRSMSDLFCVEYFHHNVNCQELHTQIPQLTNRPKYRTKLKYGDLLERGGRPNRSRYCIPKIK